MIFVLFLSVLYSLNSAFSQQLRFVDDKNDCSTQMENYRVCIRKSVNSTNVNNKRLSNQERQQLKNRISTCFTSERCQNPFPSTDYQSATRQCYQTARLESRQELQSCVRREISGFVLPEDETQYIENMQLAASLLTASQDPKLCPFFANKARIVECIKKETVYFQNSRAATANLDVCKVREVCNAQIGAKCTSLWNDRAAPALCKCISADLLTRYRQEYNNCVQDKRFKVQSNDPTGGLLESSIKAWCPTKTTKDPCPGITTTPTTTTTTTTTVAAATEYEISTDDNAAAETTTVVTTTSTAETTAASTLGFVASTTTLIPNQNFFNALGSDQFLANLVKNSPGLKVLTDLFSGKTDLSAIFPSANLIGDYSVGLTNMFTHVGA